jgi:hypothetical protein
MDISKIEYVTWWRLFVILGLIIFGFSVLYADSIDIVDPRCLAGIGIGMFLTGLSCWIANKHLASRNSAVNRIFCVVDDRFYNKYYFRKMHIGYK